MRFYDIKIGYKIIDIVYVHKLNGIGRNELVRLSGYAKDTIDEWLYRLRNFGFIRIYPKYPVCLTEDAIQKYNIKNLIIPQDPNFEKFKKLQHRKHFVKIDLDKKYAEIIILILSLAVFGNIKPIEYKKSKLGLMIVHNPIDSNQTYLYGTTNQLLPGIGLSDLINKLPKKSSESHNEKAVLPKYYTNYDNNELFGYLKLSKEVAQKYITLLSKKYKILIPIINNKRYSEIRYEISDELLKEFVQQCILAFHNDVDQRLEYAYIYNFMDKKQVKDYFKFLRIWYGKGRKNSNICEYLNRTRDRKKDNNSKEHYRKYIDKCNKDIFHYELFEPKIEKYEYDKYELSIGERYKPLQEKYPWIRNIFFDTLFPQFLRKIWYEQNKNQNK
jgi:hypothetical protein